MVLVVPQALRGAPVTGDPGNDGEDGDDGVDGAGCYCDQRGDGATITLL